MFPRLPGAFLAAGIPAAPVQESRMLLQGILIALGLLAALLPVSNPDPFAPCRELRPGFQPVLIKGVWICEKQPPLAPLHGPDTPAHSLPVAGQARTDA